MDYPDFCEFTRTRQYCHVNYLPEWVDRELLPPNAVGCYLYRGGWIADCDSHFLVVIDRDEITDSDLSRLEESLYTHLYL